MKTNYLYEVIDNFFQEITSYEGDLLAIHELIRYFEKNLDIDSIRGNDLMGLVSTFRDPTFIGTGPDLFGTGHRYEITKKNFRDSLNRLESGEALYVFAQIYEAFESYLKKIIRTFFINNPLYLNKDRLFSRLHSESPNYKIFIDKLQRTSGTNKNNKKLLWTVRKLSSYYCQYESNNRYKVPYMIWFDLISDVRHLVIHQRQNATSEFKESLRENQKRKYFDKYFEIKNIQGVDRLFTNRMSIGAVIHDLNHYAFFIYKSLSRELDLDVKYSPLEISP